MLSSVISIMVIRGNIILHWTLPNMSPHRLKCQNVIIASVFGCIGFAGFTYLIQAYYNPQQPQTRHAQAESPPVSAHDNKIKRDPLKINAVGEYQTFCGFTIISMCQVEKLKYLEEYIENTKVLRKVLSPLPSSSYHMTTYDIYTNSQPPKKFVRNWLDADKTRILRNEKCIQPMDVIEIMTRAQEVWAKDRNHGNQQFNVTTGHLRIGSGVSVAVSVQDPKLMRFFHKARAECDKIFGKTDRKLSPHITLGYWYSNISDLTHEDQALFTEELAHLEKILPTSFTMNPPTVMSFSSMTKFTPVID